MEPLDPTIQGSQETKSQSPSETFYDCMGTSSSEEEEEQWFVIVEETSPLLETLFFTLSPEKQQFQIRQMVQHLMTKLQSSFPENVHKMDKHKFPFGTHKIFRYQCLEFTQTLLEYHIMNNNLPNLNWKQMTMEKWESVQVTFIPQGASSLVFRFMWSSTESFVIKMNQILKIVHNVYFIVIRTIFQSMECFFNTLLYITL